MDPIIAAIKRLLRVSLDAALAAGITTLFQELSKIPVPFIFQPILTALLAALGKYIRDKTGIRAPI